MKAYKVFNHNWTCRGFQYEVGQSYHCDGKIELCSNGFHACEKASDCFSYYPFDSENHVAEVELSGTILTDNDGKSCASDITVVKEIDWQTVLQIVNDGKNCTGLCNSGNWNSGDRNSGDRNSGNWNSGNWNTGDKNSGNCNTGNWNSGNRNSGNCNTGDWNSGNCNTGNWNTGDKNSGNCNTGNWNSGNRNSGFFNTTSPELRMFNKQTNRKLEDIYFPSFLYFDLTTWVSYDTATPEEKKAHKQEIETCGGFLKKIDYKTAFQIAWSNASDDDKEYVKNLPNFDADVFFEISGIRVE